MVFAYVCDYAISCLNFGQNIIIMTISRFVNVVPTFVLPLCNETYIPKHKNIPKTNTIDKCVNDRIPSKRDQSVKKFM